MNAKESERFLYSLDLFGMRFGLDRMQRLMTVLGSPQLTYETIHVLGTNGKSSTTRMIAEILAAHDHHVGAYLSPHIEGFAERIEIDGHAVDEFGFARAVTRTARAAEMVGQTLDAGDCVTQFELLSAAALWELGRAGVEVGVIEAGLGGRYDATSVIVPRVHVLTNIGLEHTRWLGPTERHIAEEKLAVVPEGGSLVSGPLAGDAANVAASRGATWLMAGRDFGFFDDDPDFTVQTSARSYERLRLGVLGEFQRRNFALAVAASESWLGDLDPGRVRVAAARVFLPGRLEPVGSEPLVLMDGAHNPSGLKALRESLPRVTEGRDLTAVVSILDDKDAATMLEILGPLCRRIVFTRSSHRRTLSPATLESLNRQVGGPAAEVEADPGEAVQRARTLAGRGGVVLVCGSMHLLADIRATAHHVARRKLIS